LSARPASCRRGSRLYDADVNDGGLTEIELVEHLRRDVDPPRRRRFVAVLNDDSLVGLLTRGKDQRAPSSSASLVGSGSERASDTRIRSAT
jgi:hypothetical protein